MIAAIYARKSTEQHIADEQKSVRRQIEHAGQYAVRKGWTVDEACIFVDDGISGAEFARRPGFLRLMNALKPRAGFQVLILSELSRLGREQLETGYALKQLSEAGVRVVSYLEDREVLLDTPTNKFLLSAVSFASEIEREKAQQRTYDALLRRARSGHVAGGRVFGYDNVRTGSHVERRINQAEAAVIRHIFELCVEGLGQVAIAKQLNAENAVAPKSQQGRPRAWAPSSVREVWYRDLYRGVVVWNRTKKRDQWGKVRFQTNPESEWLRVPAPHLRIVSDDLWNQAHARLTRTRQTYLSQTNGQLWGRPPDGRPHKYLLTGLARCGHCGGSLEVRSGTNGYSRAHFYACSSYWRRGKTVCQNSSLIPLHCADAAVLDELRHELLTPDFVESVVAKVLRRAAPARPSEHERKAELQQQLLTVTRELQNQVDALADLGRSPTLLEGIKKREARKADFEQQLARLDRHNQVAHTETDRLAELARTTATEWHTVLGSRTPQARQVLAKMLREKLSVRPEQRNGQDGYRFTGEGTLEPLVEGFFAVSRAVASPPGFEPGFQP